MTNLFILALLAAIVVNLLLGVVVYLTHMRRLANCLFAILSCLFALWLACQYFGAIAADEVWLVFWIRQACAMSAPIPLLLHLLCGAVAQPGETTTRLLRRSRPWVLAVFAVGLLSQTRFFLVGARLPAGGGVIAEPLYGPGFILFVGFWVISVATLLWSFFRSLSQAEGGCRMELQIMALGSFFGLVPGVLLVLVIPLITGSAQSARFTPIAVVIWHGVIAYGIATRHIMGAGELLRRTITYALLTGFLIVLYVLAFHLVDSLPLDGGGPQRTAAHVVAAVVVALTLAPANAFLRYGADRLFDDGRGDLSQLLHQGGEVARSITTVDTLFHDFGLLLQQSLALSHVRVYLRTGPRYVLHARMGAVETAEVRLWVRVIRWCSPCRPNGIPCCATCCGVPGVRRYRCVPSEP